MDKQLKLNHKLRDPVLEHDVLRLDVQVDDAAAVHEVQRLDNLTEGGNLKRLFSQKLSLTGKYK